MSPAHQETSVTLKRGTGQKRCREYSGSGCRGTSVGGPRDTLRSTLRLGDDRDGGGLSSPYPTAHGGGGDATSALNGVCLPALLVSVSDLYGASRVVFGWMAFVDMKRPQATHMQVPSC